MGGRGIPLQIRNLPGRRGPSALRLSHRYDANFARLAVSSSAICWFFSRLMG
jgi:hypothetical protein